MKQTVAFLLLLLFIFSACKKDDDDDTIYQVKYEVVNLLAVNSHIKITYTKDENINVIDGALAAGQKWELTYSGRSGELTFLSGLVLNDSAHFDLRIIVDQNIFAEDKGICTTVCDSTFILISGTLN